MGNDKHEEAFSDADHADDVILDPPAPNEDQQVEIHKPKPVHSWREFLNELGVIFLGVLIALAVESAAEEWRWHARVAETREQLRYEMGNNLALLDNRMSKTACVSERVDHLAALVQSAINTSRLAPLGDIGELTAATWPVGVWQSAVSAQTAAHFPSRELAALSRTYGFLGAVKQMADRDALAWETVRTMVGPGRPITPDIAERWIAALVLIRSDNARFGSFRNAMVRVLDQSELGKAFPKVDPRSPPVLYRNAVAACPPFGPPPATFAAALPAR